MEPREPRLRGVPEGTTRSVLQFDTKWGAIPPAELEIIRMKKESQSMFAKRTRPMNAPHSLGDVPLFVPTEHLEDEAVKTHDPGAVEAWVNAHLLRGAIQLIPLSGSYVADDASHDAKKQALLYQSKLEYNDIQTIFSSPDKSPLEGAGIDSGSLLRLGMPKAIVDRIFRGLFVYSSGFHTLIHEIGRHCPAYAESHIAANIWLTFLHLLEKCEDGRYEMAMLKFNHATAVWKQNAIREYELQTSTLQAAIVAAHAETHAERAIVAERVAEVTSRDATIAALQAELQAAHEATAASDDLVRLANLEILELENTVAATRKELADTSQSLHVALAEKSNLQGELTGYIHELQNVDDFKAKVDEQKTRAADRMRELQAANQAVMDELDLAKRDIKAGSIERLKHHAAREVLALSNIKLEAKVAALSAELHTAVTALAAKTSALDEADATVLSLKQVMEKDRGACASLTADVAALTLQIGQQKRDYMVLEAQAQLLLMEKKNNHMREGDRLRIERLLNKKVELEKDIEAMRIEREKSQEHLWNVRASLESVENELQLAKRAFATSQTSLQQLDKVNDQLRSQIAEMERNVERMTIGFNAMRDRCQVVEDGAKESVDKVELELKVAMSQMREMAYTRRENECQIHDLAKATIEANHMEVKILHQRLEQQDKLIRNMTVERDALVREKRVLQLESNASQLVMSQLNKSTTGLMDRIRKHEVTFDEAIVELKGHYEHAFALGNGHLEASLGSGDVQHVSLPSKSAAAVMHKSVVAVMALMDMRHENPAFSTTKRRHSLKGHELKVQCEYRIVELGQEIARREAERIELLRLLAVRDERIVEEKQRTQVEIGRRNMHAERSLLVLEDFAARLLRFRAYEQATTRKIMDQEFELYQYKHRVANLRDRVATLKLMLDQSGMAEEDASGYLTIEKIRFITRVDEAIQAVEDMADGSTQTYPPKRSPIKERAKLHGMDFSAPESVLTNITSLIPDEELDHHFFSLTHHGRDATTEYAQGHLLRRSIAKTKGAVLPKLTQASLEKAPHRAPFVRTNVIADYETQFGLHARIAMGSVGPFAVSRPVSNPEDSSELGDDFGPFASFTRDISEHDYSSPHLTSPRAKSNLTTRVVGGGGRLQSVPKKSPVPPPMRPAQRHPKAHGVRRARPTRHDMSQVINVPSGTVEYDVAVLDALRTQQPVYRHVDGNGLQYHLDNANLQDDGDDDDDDDGGNRLDDYFTTNDDGMLVARVESQPNAHVPTLLEQRIKAHHEATTTSEGPHAGWDLRGNNHVLKLHGESTPLPPVLYPLTKS